MKWQDINPDCNLCGGRGWIRPAICLAGNCDKAQCPCTEMWEVFMDLQVP
jgi:hypothetical protein